MQVSATVRVKPDVLGSKPDRAKLEEAARLLKDCGFNILRVGRFGVSIKGEAASFSDVLGVEPKPDKALSAEAHPAQQELRDLVDLVEVTPEPQLYRVHAKS
jgi:hypothetical protein